MFPVSNFEMKQKSVPWNLSDQQDVTLAASVSIYTQNFEENRQNIDLCGFHKLRLYGDFAIYHST